MRDVWLFLEHLGRVVNWPNFIIVLSQEIGRPKEGERDGEHRVCGVVSTHAMFMDYVHHLTKARSVVPAPGRQNHNSHIKDHWSQISTTNITIMEKFEILVELLKCNTETQSEQMLENWPQQTFSKQGCHKPSICEKHYTAKCNKIKCHKTRCACNNNLLNRRS